MNTITVSDPVSFSVWRANKAWEIVEILREFTSEDSASDGELLFIALSAIKQTMQLKANT